MPGVNVSPADRLVSLLDGNSVAGGGGGGVSDVRGVTAEDPGAGADNARQTGGPAK